ncbi:hypothetical protein N9Z22_00785 [bacterium]|nr:hypothetical protein [bacterium]
MRELHITNAEGKDTCVGFAAATVSDRPPKLGKMGEPAEFIKYLATTEEGTHEALTMKSGEDDYGQALIDGDPEIDMEKVGIRLGESRRVYIEYDWQEKDGKAVKSGGGRIRHAPPSFLEVLTNPDGSERERRKPQDIEANINEELPLHWTGKKLPRAEAAKRFVMNRTIQLFHNDGLTYDYLFQMAGELAKEDVLMLIGAGDKGKAPLIFQANGTPYRGFLEGRVDGKSYKLLLHLSNLELKVP